MDKIFEKSRQMTLKMPHVIKPMANSPFAIKEDAEMQKLRESIKQFGILTPIVIRQVSDDHKTVFEIVSGNRRFQILKELNYTAIPVMIYDMSDDDAMIAMIDSNLCHRENILPSEKAKAYQMKLDAMKRQGHRADLEEDATCTQVGYKSKDGKSIQTLADESNDSREQIRRYIRLNNLIPELLTMVDEGKIAFTPAVELSYLTEEQQYSLLDTIEAEDRTPSLSQAVRFKKLSQANELTDEQIETIMQENKANQRPMFKMPMERLQKAIPKMKPEQLEDYILKACEHYRKYLLRQQNRNAR